MSGIDWSKAPEGATHWEPQLDQIPEGWMRHSAEGRWYFWHCLRSEWVACPVKEGERVGRMIPRPSPAWNGKGLPPVGVTLEYMWNYRPEGSEYVQVEILVYDKGSAVMRTLDGPDPGVLRESRGGYCGSGRGQPIFRPIRTPEQIAADEREAAIDSMVQFFMNYYGNPKGAEQYLLICRSLHDAGYRKQEQPK